MSWFKVLISRYFDACFYFTFSKCWALYIYVNNYLPLKSEIYQTLFVVIDCAPEKHLESSDGPDLRSYVNKCYTGAEGGI